MSDLRADLDAALRTAEPSPAPIEAAIARGRRIQARRRAMVIAAAIAVVAAVAVGYPAASRLAAGPPPAQSAPPQLALVTDAPPSRGTPPGTIAMGQVGSTEWQVSVDKPGGSGPGGRPQCFDIALDPGAATKTGWDASTPLSGSVLDNGGSTNCDLQYPGSQAPVALEGTGGNSMYVMAGGVAADVRYLVLHLADGQVIKSIPHAAYGERFLAYAAPISDRVVTATAYTDDGQPVTAVPFVLPGGLPFFGLWAAPGQALPRVATVLLGSGVAKRQNWSVVAYGGPWGACVTSASGPDGSSTDCRGAEPTTALTVLGFGDSGGSMPFDVYGFAPQAATRLELALADGRNLDVRVLAAGNQKLWSFTLTKGQPVSHLTAYSAAGHLLGSTSLP
jgi:hypothetical protein